jgi:hypothetical protein
MRYASGRDEGRRSGMEDAHNLVAHLRSGGAPVPVATGLRLEPDETAFARTSVWTARYYAQPGAPYDRTTLLGLGSLGTITVTAIGSATRNSHQRRQADRAAATQWRPAGWSGAVVTSRRLLLLPEGAWTSIRYPRILQLDPRPERQQLDLLFEDAPALRCEGPSVPLVTVLFFYLLHRREVALPELRT